MIIDRIYVNIYNSKFEVILIDTLVTHPYNQKEGLKLLAKGLDLLNTKRQQRQVIWGKFARRYVVFTFEITRIVRVIK